MSTNLPIRHSRGVTEICERYTDSWMWVPDSSTAESNISKNQDIEHHLCGMWRSCFLKVGETSVYIRRSSIKRLLHQQETFHPILHQQGSFRLVLHDGYDWKRNAKTKLPEQTTFLELLILQLTVIERERTIYPRRPETSIRRETSSTSTEVETLNTISSLTCSWYRRAFVSVGSP